MKYMLYGEKDKIADLIIHIIYECSKLLQKEYKSKHYWVGKVIHEELCKRLKFNILKNGTCTNQNLS